MTQTVFGQIIEKTIPADIVYEDDLCLAFKDVHPQAPCHILLIPKEKIDKLSSVNLSHQQLLGHLMVKAPEIAKQMGYEDFRVVINNGDQGGQEVYHLHLHILAGRQMVWPPG